MISLVLVVGLLGSGPDKAAAPKALPPPASTYLPYSMVKKKNFIIPEATVTVTLTPGAKGKFKVRPVKTEQGYRIKVETSEVTIEVTSVLVKSEGSLYFLQVDEKNGEMLGRTFKDGQAEPGQTRLRSWVVPSDK